jgi:4-amino-4-deoxy-L-arabinose transferase-like glycosyltransferase
VAWVAERKDVLSTFFLLLTLWAYWVYTRSPGIVRMIPVAALFALGLLSKPMLVTLPFVLLLLDYWPLGRTSAPEKPAPQPLPTPGIAFPSMM